MSIYSESTPLQFRKRLSLLIAAQEAVPANGGTPRQVTKLDTGRGETSHLWPVFLADGKHFLFFVRTLNPEMAGIFAGSVDSQDYHMVVRTAQGPAFEARGAML
jgi:hypothetical protein